MSGGLPPIHDDEVETTTPPARRFKTAQLAAELNSDHGALGTSPERPVGATRVNKGDRLRLVLLAGVGCMAMMLVLLRLKGGSATVPVPTIPVNQVATANGTVFAEDLVRQLSSSPGVTRAVGSYVPSTGVVVSIDAVDLKVDDLKTWLSDALIPIAGKSIVGLENEHAILVFDVTGGAPFVRTIAVPIGALEDPSGYLPSATLDRNADPAGVPVSAVAPTTSASSTTTPAPSTASPGPATTLQASPTSAAPAPGSQSGASSSLPAPTTVAASGATTAALGTVERFDATSADWTPLSGQWKVADGVYQQLDNSGYDFITQYALPLPDKFEVSAKFSAATGDLNAGFLLFQAKKGSRNNSVVVDLVDKGRYVRWGHFDQGGVYVFDGGNTLAAAVNPTVGMTFKVTYSDGVARIYIDNKQVGEFKPASTTGSAGLLSSVSVIAVDDFLLTAP